MRNDGQVLFLLIEIGLYEVPTVGPCPAASVDAKSALALADVLRPGVNNCVAQQPGSPLSLYEPG